MPSPVPLLAVAERLRAAPWRRLDIRCAVGAPHGLAWVQGDALVAAWGPPAVVHAIGEHAHDATAALLAAVRDELPPRLELRVGPAAAGVLAKTHHIELIGPMQRLRWVGRDSAPPPGLVALGRQHTAEIAALADRDAPFVPRWVDLGGWIGVRRGSTLIAAIGPRASGPGAVLLAPPRLDRRHDHDDVVVSLIAEVARRFEGEVGLDLRLDRQDRIQASIEAGFAPACRWERWWATRSAAS